MSNFTKYFAQDKEAYGVLNDPKKLTKVLLVMQEATDAYMKKAQEELKDPRRSVQQKAQKTLGIAQAIIRAERYIRELELYNIHKLKKRGLKLITDV